MGSLYQLPQAADVHARLLQNMVRSAIDSHPDRQVAERWGQMAADTLGRHGAPPMPSQPLLDLDRVPELDAYQREALQELVSEWLQAYFNDVRQQLMAVHKDILSLQMRVAELEAGYREE